MYGYKSFTQQQEARLLKACNTSFEGSLRRVNNGFSRPEKLSGQLIETQHSHQTHMIENSCEIPCCIPSPRRRSGGSTSLRPGAGWCHGVLRFSRHRIAVQRPRIFKMQETQPGESGEAGGRSSTATTSMFSNAWDTRHITI